MCRNVVLLRSCEVDMTGRWKAEQSGDFGAHNCGQRISSRTFFQLGLYFRSKIVRSSELAQDEDNLERDSTGSY